MTFKEKIKEAIAKNNKSVMGKVWKVEMLTELLKVKNPKNKISKEFFRIFVEAKVDFDNDMIHHTELSLGQIKRLKSLFDSKTKKTECKRIINYIRKETDKYLFKYEMLDEMKNINILVDDCFNKMEKEIKKGEKRK